MGAREKIAYLKGIIDGQNLADTPEKAKFYTALTDALESLAAAMEEHENVHEELNDYLEQLDDDVAKLEDDFDECSCGDEDEDEDGEAREGVQREIHFPVGGRGDAQAFEFVAQEAVEGGVGGAEVFGPGRGHGIAAVRADGQCGPTQP